MKKILWITFNPLPQFSGQLDGKTFSGSSWLQPLAQTLTEYPGIKLGVICPSTDSKMQKLERGNITQYTVPVNINKSKYFSRLYPELLKHYLEIIRSFEPNIIHVHGTEKFFGLITKYVKVPVIISIQGYVSSCIPHLTGEIPPKDFYKNFSIKNLIGRGGIINLKNNWRKYLSPMEIEIIKQNKFFIGRTDWDKNYLLSINNNAKYFHGDELLRPSFYSNHWDYETCEKYSIFISNANYPLKGLHVLLMAVGLIKDEFHKIKIKIPMDEHKFWSQNILWGNDYLRYLKSLIRKLKLRNHVDFIGFQSEEGMAFVFRKTHIFAIPSFIENSSNALGEAMMSGIPCISNNTGGLTSIIVNEVNGLTIENADYRFLASQIKRLFSDLKLAKKLSTNARQTALKRHDPIKTKKMYFNIYKHIIEENNTST